MNNKEELQKAAEECVQTIKVMEAPVARLEFDRFDMEDAFKAGAEWQRNSVWHDGSEMPDHPMRHIVYKSGDGYHIGDTITAVEKGHRITMWAYLSDLLPIRKEGDV